MESDNKTGDAGTRNWGRVEFLEERSEYFKRHYLTAYGDLQDANRRIAELEGKLETARQRITGIESSFLLMCDGVESYAGRIFKTEKQLKTALESNKILREALEVYAHRKSKLPEHPISGEHTYDCFCIACTESSPGKIAKEVLAKIHPINNPQNIGDKL